MNYKLNEHYRKMRARALELIGSVPYAVTARWLFYRLLQEGYYSTKADYKNKWICMCSKYRKQFLEGWHPTILIDDTRQSICRTGGDETIDEGIQNLASRVQAAVDLTVDHFYQQEHYVEIWFEARAMVGQFRHYTDGIDLIPFGGDPSIEFKARIATHLDKCNNTYGKDMVVLYFGDYDHKGLQILDSAEEDIRSWCHTDFELVRCGLTLEQAKKYKIPESIERAGEFQWEALPDYAAAEIIKSALADYIDIDLIHELAEESGKVEAEWQGKIYDAVDNLLSEDD